MTLKELYFPTNFIYDIIKERRLECKKSLYFPTNFIYDIIDYKLKLKYI